MKYHSFKFFMVTHQSVWLKSESVVFLDENNSQNCL